MYIAVYVAIFPIHGFVLKLKCVEKLDFFT